MPKEADFFSKWSRDDGFTDDDEDDDVLCSCGKVIVLCPCALLLVGCSLCIMAQARRD